MSREYPPQPIVSVGVIAWREERVLLVRRGHPPKQGEWSIPGGGIELGETVAETAAREAAEECGIVIGPPEVLAVVDLIDRDERGLVRYHFVLIDVIAPWLSGEARAGDDAAEVRWVSRSELDELELWAETRRIVELAFDRIAAAFA